MANKRDEKWITQAKPVVPPDEAENSPEEVTRQPSLSSLSSTGPNLESQLLRQAWEGVRQHFNHLEISTKVLLPGYDVEPQPLGKGGQGAVYRAVQKNSRTLVAIKFLYSSEGLTDAMKQRFAREITLLRHLKHPYIVKIFDSGIDPHPYYVMEYIKGSTLTDYVENNKISAVNTVRLMTKVCAAIYYAHQHDVIHRDLKPPNILVEQNGNPKILDFGLAKQLGTSTTITAGMELAGTLAYMAPEQAGLQAREKTDPRTDTYTLGLILYRLLTRQFPYPVDVIKLGEKAVLNHIIHTPATNPQHLPKSSSMEPVDHSLAAILLKSLAKNPEERYQDAGFLAADLHNYLRGRPLLALNKTI